MGGSSYGKYLIYPKEAHAAVEDVNLSPAQEHVMIKEWSDDEESEEQAAENNPLVHTLLREPISRSRSGLSPSKGMTLVNLVGVLHTYECKHPHGVVHDPPLGLRYSKPADTVTGKWRDLFSSNHKTTGCPKLYTFLRN